MGLIVVLIMVFVFRNQSTTVGCNDEHGKCCSDFGQHLGCFGGSCGTRVYNLLCVFGAAREETHCCHARIVRRRCFGPTSSISFTSHMGWFTRWLVMCYCDGSDSLGTIASS